MRKLILICTVSLACMTSTIPSAIAVKSETSQPTQPTQTAMHSTIVTATTSEPDSGAVYTIPTPGPLCATVTAIQSLHLRDLPAHLPALQAEAGQPNEKARVLAYLHNGEQVRVIILGPPARELVGGWWKISTDKGTGYANAKYLRLTECR